MFITIKRMTILIIIAIFLVIVTVVFYFTAIQTSIAKPEYVVVIDAGHGGIDGGCEGYAGTVERDINLEYAKTLKSYCDDFGFKTVMTRTNENGLYSPFASNKKKDDMLARQKIIEKTNPDIVISIHMNSYAVSSSRGAQVFFNSEIENSKLLADEIQKQFVKNLVKPRQTTQKGDYFILNCTNIPSVIVECGFISNQEEEQLLISDGYKDKVCYSILCGILSYMM